MVYVSCLIISLVKHKPPNCLEKGVGYKFMGDGMELLAEILLALFPVWAAIIVKIPTGEPVEIKAGEFFVFAFVLTVNTLIGLLRGVALLSGSRGRAVSLLALLVVLIVLSSFLTANSLKEYNLWVAIFIAFVVTASNIVIRRKLLWDPKPNPQKMGGENLNRETPG